MLINELFPGVALYHNVITPDLDIINRLEDTIKDSNLRRTWKSGEVGYRDLTRSYRDCLNIKIQKNNSFYKTDYDKKFDSIWDDVYGKQKPIVDNYCEKYGIQMNYWEAMNFIKYQPGQHFDEHSDHGYSYVCTVSLVTYLNDDYEGGELYFPKIGIKIKPEAGDMLVFPSTYLFSHKAEPVISGTKYCIATMLDYNKSNAI